MPADGKKNKKIKGKKQQCAKPRQRLTRSTMAAKQKDTETDSNSDEGEIVEHPSGVVAEDIASIYALLQKISSETKTLPEIRQATRSVEGKLTELTARIGHVEGRLAFLEDAEKTREVDPPATMVQLNELRDRLDLYEDRNRKNNLRFVNIGEHCEAAYNGDVIALLEKIITETLDVAVPAQGWLMERAHRLGARADDSGDGTSCRTIIARFFRSGDRDKILRAAQSMKEELRWEGKRLMIFPDYSRGTLTKRGAFKDCKQALHDRGVKFALLHPATLRINTPGGPVKSFTEPAEALEFINKLPLPPALSTTSVNGSPDEQESGIQGD